MPATPQQVRELIDFLREAIVRDPETHIDESTALVSSGLVDSFALVEIILKLQQVTKRKIRPAQVNPEDLETVTLMFAAAERIGIPNANA